MMSWLSDLRLCNEYPDKSLLECWKIANNETINNRKFSHNIFYDYFSKFDNQSIEKSLSSENAIVRMLTILDRRVGKRRIISIV